MCCLFRSRPQRICVATLLLGVGAATITTAQADVDCLKLVNTAASPHGSAPSPWR